MMLTREQVLKITDKILKEGYPWKHELNFLVDTDAKQRQTIEAQALALNKALDDQYIPGVWSCTQCQFGLVSTYLYVNSGTASPDTDTMPMCPNDGSLLRRVIWKECVRSYDEYIERLLKEKEAQAQRIKELEAQIKAFEQDSIVCKLEAALERQQEEP